MMLPLVATSAPFEVLDGSIELLFVDTAPSKKKVSRDGLGVLLVVAIIIKEF